MRVLVGICWLLSICLTLSLCLMPSIARADTIAMLPLDTEKRLELYSQPVAAEIGRALKAAGYDVVVVKANESVPAQAKLIVDGKITKAKGKDVTVAIRIRDPRDGTTLEDIPAQTTAIDNIDKAAAEISGKVVPLVQAHLAKLAKPPDKPTEKPGEKPVPPPAPVVPVVLASVSGGKTAGPRFQLRDALGTEVVGWAHAEHHDAKIVPDESLKKKTAVKTIGDAHTDAGIAFEVLSFEIETEDGVPMARARVRVRIASAAEVKFERIVRTDTVVGEKGMANDALAARTARAVLAIMTPNIRRALGTWRR